MTLETLVAITKALNAAGARFLVVGGVAVNLHGYTRMTQDLDLVVDLSAANTKAAIAALASLGYRPQVPVAIEDFADEQQRRDWITNKHMEVFSLISERHPETTVDVFVREPFTFDEEYRLADHYQIAPGVTLPTVRPETLIAMKRVAGRPRDMDDIQHLDWIIEERHGSGSDD